jgi:tetratricopeptide (TPR) repeat protein
MKKGQIKDKAGMYSPYFKENNGKFKGVKTKDKALKKEFKEKEKTIKASLKTNDLHAAAKTFIEIHETEKSLNSAYNVGLCYELIGNFTKAKEYYDMAGDKGALENMQNLLALKAQFEGLGLEVSETDF